MPNWLRKILFVLLLGIFLYSSVTLIRYWCNSRKQADLFTDLALSVENAKEAPVSTVDPELPTLPGKTPDTPRRILPEYQALYQRNSDMAGWISIPDTCINYPVMHTPQVQDAYLYANFQKEYSVQGSIFAQGNCDLNRPSDNIILYGHNMRDGSMFAALSSYLDPDFYAEHPIICFDSLYERRTYEIICVFITTATLGEGFDYPAFVEALSPEEEETACAVTVKLDYKQLFLMAVATSIDALAVGVTFAFLEVEILPAITIIGCTTFVLSMAGVAVGNFFGSRYKKRAELSGGIILILLGLKILLEHLELF